MTIALIIFTVHGHSSQPKEMPELKKVFDKQKVDGSILIYHQNENIFVGYNLERCNIAFCPASTFKIPNTLIALESGIATIETVFTWNGEKRTFFYIHECAANFWSKYALRDYLRSDLYNKRGTMPNNFTQTMPDIKQALKAIGVFKDEYLVDYINVEQLGELEKDLDERVIEKSIVANIRKFIMTVGHDFSFIGKYN